MRERALPLFQSLIDLLDASATGALETKEPELLLFLNLAGTELLLKHAAPGAAGIRVLCRLGPVPETSAVDVLKRLLEINLYLAESGAGALGCDGSDGDVILSFPLDLATTTADALLRAVNHAAAQAAHWRATNFLDKEPGSSPPHGAHFPLLA